MTAVLLLAGAAMDFGGTAVYWTSALSGTVDCDAAVVSLSGLSRAGSLSAAGAMAALLLVLASNAVVKTGIAMYAAGTAFAYAVTFGCGLAVWWLAGRLVQRRRGALKWIGCFVSDSRF